MKQAAQRILLAGSVVAGLLALAWLGGHLFTGRSQLARAVAWMQADIGDHRRFPSRPIANAAPRFDFRAPTAEEAARYAPALATVEVADGAATSQPLERFLERSDTVAFLVIRDDVLLYERYFQGHGRESIVTSFSVAKSFLSALVGIAIAEGRIGSVEDPVTRYVPELLQRDPRFGRITLRHLLTMASGLRYEETGTPWGDDARTYYGTDLRALALSAKVAEAPGQRFHYNNYNPLLLGLVLERSTGMPVAKYLEAKLWKPLGMEAPGSWSLDSERSGFEKMESGLNARAIDFARFGRLYLHRGNWNGAQLVPAGWVADSTRFDTGSDPVPYYQYLWWVDPDAGSHFFASGNHGQKIYVVPQQGLVFVRFGRSDPHRRWERLFSSIARRIAATDAHLAPRAK